MTITVVGSGAREHAALAAFLKSPQKPAVCVISDKKNPAMERLASGYAIISDLTDAKSIAEKAASFSSDFVFLGPESCIVAGTADELNSLGIPAIGPTKKLAQLEGSKGYTRALAQKHSVPGSPGFEYFTHTGGPIPEIKKQALHLFLERHTEGFVIKDDGLAGGKGVLVSGDHVSGVTDGIVAAEAALSRGAVVLEEKLIGPEFSLIFFTDGTTLSPCPVIADHKRALVGDAGPNTGGMGSYSDANHSLPFLEERDLQEAMDITEAMLKAAQEDTGETYRGILYGGFMACKDGVKLIEYNCRLGDPEAMNIFALLENDFVSVCQAIISGSLADTPLSFAEKASVVKYLVPAGYPLSSKVGAPIQCGTPPPPVELYLASVDEQNGETLTTTSRTAAVVACAPTLPEAEQLAEKATGCVSGPVSHRPDIATESLIGTRIELIRRIRG